MLQEQSISYPFPYFCQKVNLILRKVVLVLLKKKKVIGVTPKEDNVVLISF